MQQKFIAAGILIVGVVVAGILTFSRQSPRQEPRALLAPLVTVQRVHVQDVPMIVRGYGTVRQSVQVQVVPQVSGQVTRLHPNLVNGGFVKAGEILIQIDPADYAFQVEINKAEVARAEVRLQQELAEAAVAQAEWEEMNPGLEPESPLTVREPQIEQAQAELAAAQAQLAHAKLNLQRTRITLPFNGRVVQEDVDVSQYLVAGQPVATVYGTDKVEIVVPLEDKELAWFDVPGDGYWTNEHPPPPVQARVSADFASARHRWTGQVVRTEGQIDETSRMVNVVVEVDKPFTLTDGRPPLVPGMFVEVEIQGRILPDVVPIPRHVLHNDADVWVAVDGRLDIRPVSVARLDRDSAYVITGLTDGDLVVATPLDVVTDGMRIRPHLAAREDETPETQPPANPPDKNPLHARTQAGPTESRP